MESGEKLKSLIVQHSACLPVTLCAKLEPAIQLLASLLPAALTHFVLLLPVFYLAFTAGWLMTRPSTPRCSNCSCRLTSRPTTRQAVAKISRGESVYRWCRSQRRLEILVRAEHIVGTRVHGRSDGSSGLQATSYNCADTFLYLIDGSQEHCDLSA